MWRASIIIYSMGENTEQDLYFIKSKEEGPVIENMKADLSSL